MGTRPTAVGRVIAQPAAQPAALTGRVDVADHLQRLSLADLFVDTPQYNGGTTGAAAAAATAAPRSGVVSHTRCAQCAKRALRQAMRLRAPVAAQHIHSVRGAR